MKRTLTIVALVLAGLFAFPMTASADHRRGRWGFGFGFGFDGGYFQAGYSGGHHQPRRHVHVHSRSPIYTRVWVPAVYDTVILGYDHCGRPIHRTVMVRCGYYESVVSGYRCGGCGASCN